MGRNPRVALWMPANIRGWRVRQASRRNNTIAVSMFQPVITNSGARDQHSGNHVEKTQAVASGICASEKPTYVLKSWLTFPSNSLELPNRVAERGNRIIRRRLGVSSGGKYRRP